MAVIKEMVTRLYGPTSMFYLSLIDFSWPYNGGSCSQLTIMSTQG